MSASIEYAYSPFRFDRLVTLTQRCAHVMYSGDSDDDGSWDVGLCRDDWDVADHDYSDHWGYDDECNDLYYDEESDGGCDDNYWGESDDDPVDLLADQLATTHIDKTDNTSTMSVYRAAIVGENWDRLEPHRSLTDHQVKYRMRACSGGGTMSMAALE
ncbi:hypothetical protein BCR44DRAFT_1296599 [Catenaria anguillulae PL171]|uniref:Uncharacterized protein n=1 Tax=Catenaria anguillulae PL171 TaxID=765915 RepID=A0A1Y2HVM5_9FUNG|nr:hypothetical protein BCR44DRAFT_1296599 [Catenaria anguillulae PL171]